MSQSLLARSNVSGLLYTRFLAAAYRRFIWITDPDIASINDSEAWAKVQRDPVINHAIMRRRHAAAGSDWLMIPASDEPADQRTAEIMTDLIRQIRRFHSARFNLAESIFRGSSWGYIEGRRRPFAISEDEGMRNWWVPGEIKHVDRWRFRISRIEDGQFDEIKTRWEFFSVGKQEWAPLQSTLGWVRTTFQDLEDTLGYGKGLLQAIWFYFRSKEIVFAQGLNAVERWAAGLIQVGIDGGRPGDENRTNDEIVDEWVDQMIKHRSEHILVSDKRDEITVHPGPSTGHQMVHDFMKYLDQAVTQLILSSVLPTGGGEAGGKGSMARAKIEQETSESIFESDRKSISEDIQSTLVSMVWKRNISLIRRVLAEEGLGKLPPRCPEFVIVDKKTRDPKETMEIISSALQSGIPIRKDEVYESLGFTQPDDDDEVIEPMGGGFDFGGIAEPEPEPSIPLLDEGIEEGEDGVVAPSGEEVSIEGIEAPSMQELSLAYERAIKNGDRLTANIVRKKLWAVVGEPEAPEISDFEWSTMFESSKGGDPRVSI